MGSKAETNVHAHMSGGFLGQRCPKEEALLDPPTVRLGAQTVLPPSPRVKFCNNVTTLRKSVLSPSL
eukprot:5790890-Pleurochrysis_carterae.AAC.2